jgi:Fe-S cluster assembly protein SufB
MKTEDLKNNKEYKYGFTTDVENIRSPKGLNEDTIKFISNIKKNLNGCWNGDLKLTIG